MATADLITQLKRDFDDVYAAGKAAGGGSGDYDQGYEDGKNSAGNPLEYAIVLDNIYKDVTFPDGYELTLNLPNVTTLSSAFYNVKGIKKVTIKGNTAGNGVVFNRIFRAVQSLETLDLTEFNVKISGEMAMAFFYNSKLFEILGELDFTAVTSFSNAFAGCTTLVTITPKANTIKISIDLSQSNKLSDISIQSIIDGLVDLTGGTAQTLTLHATVGGKLTDEQKATITAKNWELVY